MQEAFNSADENVSANRSRVTFVKLNRVLIPENTVVSPLDTMKNEFGVVFDVYDTSPPSIRVENSKTIEMRHFFLWRMGKQRKVI